VITNVTCAALQGNVVYRTKFICKQPTENISRYIESLYISSKVQLDTY